MDTVKVGETVTVSCAPGYTPDVTTTATCIAVDNMDFADKSFECTEANGELSQKPQKSSKKVAISYT